MKSKLCGIVLSVTMLAVCGPTVLEAQGVAINQSTYNSLASTAIWHASAETSGILSLSNSVSHNGNTLAEFAANTPVPVDISQGGGTLTLIDNGPTIHSFIPPDSTSISSTAAISEILVALSSPQYPTYSATIDSISVSIDGGTPINVPLTLDTTSTGWEGIEIALPRSTADFSLNLDLHVPAGEGTDFYASEVYVSGLSCVPEPPTTAFVGLGALFSLVTWGRARKRNKTKK